MGTAVVVVDKEASVSASVVAMGIKGIKDIGANMWQGGAKTWQGGANFRGACPVLDHR